MLIQRSAVELRERPGVPGEVRGNPIEEHSDSRFVQRIDEVAEIIWRTEAGGGGVVGGHLVSPGRPVGVFSNGEELDVGEAHPRHVL